MRRDYTYRSTVQYRYRHHEGSSPVQRLIRLASRSLDCFRRAELMPEVSLPPALSPEALETSVHDETGASASLTSHFKGNRTLVLLLRHCL